MKKYIAQITVIGLFAASLFVVPAAGHAKDAMDNTPTADQSSAPRAKHRAIPFHGKIGAVDTGAMTLKVGKRTFQVTAETKILKDGNPATLADAVVGEQVRGTYQKAESGTLETVTLHFGAKNAPKPKVSASEEQ